MAHFICCVPVSPIRKEPAHRAEMISQQLFGEECILLEEKNDWMRIQMRWDNYEGWITKNHVLPIDSFDDSIALTTEWITEVKWKGENMFLPLGCNLHRYEKAESKWLGHSFSTNGKLWNPREHKPEGDAIKNLAFQFLNTPYLWGGRSVFGIDCSGLVQLVFKFFNIRLPRDSSQQVLIGKEFDLKNAHCGDLAFFENEHGKVTHVGILLNNQTIIHASGKVRIDPIDDKGIISADTGLRTHQLHSVRRYF